MLSISFHLYHFPEASNSFMSVPSLVATINLIPVIFPNVSCCWKDGHGSLCRFQHGAISPAGRPRLLVSYPLGVPLAL